jgi:hypothetical protein
VGGSLEDVLDAAGGVIFGAGTCGDSWEGVGFAAGVPSCSWDVGGAPVDASAFTPLFGVASPSGSGTAAWSGAGGGRLSVGFFG